MDRTVPVINIGRAFSVGGRDPRIAQELGKACETIGFAVLVNHGIPQSLLDRNYAVMRTLFSLPHETLAGYETPENGRQTGYSSPQIEHAKDKTPEEGDLKHFWHIRGDATIDLWPSQVPELLPATIGLYQKLFDLGRIVLSALEMHLRLPERALIDMVPEGRSLLRLLHYPPVDAAKAKKGCIRSSAHEDINLVTLLVAATASGLQVKDRQGAWHDVDETPGSIVLNVGDMLQLYTKGRLVSTTHRVVNPVEGDASERYSMPFFIHPRGEVVLDAETGFTAGQFLRQRLIEIGVLKA